jgi:hypothetical protein
VGLKKIVGGRVKISVRLFREVRMTQMTGNAHMRIMSAYKLKTSPDRSPLSHNGIFL